MAIAGEILNESWAERLGRGLQEMQALPVEEQERLRKDWLEKEKARIQARNEAEVVARNAGAFAARVEVRKALQEAQVQPTTAAPDPEPASPFEEMLNAYREIEGGSDGRTELIMRLYFEDKSQGQRKLIFCEEATLSAEDAQAEGDLGLERRTQAYADASGYFGAYEWRLKGWVQGRQAYDLTKRINVMPAPGYVAPEKPVGPLRMEEPKPAPVNPLNQLTELFGVTKQLREAMGIGAQESGGKMDALQVSLIQQGAASAARWEASEAHRREMDELRERHRHALEEAEKKGFDRGKAEAERDLRHEYDRRIWDLEHQVKPEAEPSIVSEVVGALGGPTGVSSLVGAVLSNLNAPKPQALRPPPRPVALNPAPQAVAPPAAPQPLPQAQEPTRAQLVEALDKLGYTLSLLDDQAEVHPGDAAVLDLQSKLGAYRASGMAEGSLATWWAEWPKAEPICDQLIQGLEAQDEPETDQEEPMDFKTRLVQRLTEGATNDAILQELQATATPEEMEQLKALAQNLPVPLMAGLLGASQHQERIGALRDRLVERLK